MHQQKATEKHPFSRAFIRKPWLVLGVSVLAIGALVFLLYWPHGQRGAGSSHVPLVVYCAAGLKGPVEQVARQYEQASGVPIDLQYGGSGALLSSIRVVRRGDIFLAAEDSYIQEARRQGLVAECIPLAQMRAVIVTKKGNPKNIRSVDDLLLRSDVTIALANPEAAAVGKVTRDLLVKSRQWEALAQRTKVFKPTVADVANDVKLPGIDAGIVWDATVSQHPDLEVVRVPAFDSARGSVSVGVLSDTVQPTAALRFARYLGALDQGLPVMKKWGFEPVEGDVWEQDPKITLYSGAVNRVAIEQTVKQFEQREGVAVTCVYNGCGILTAQMRAITKGQRPEVFPDAYLACDVSFMTSVQDLFGDSLNVSETDMVILVAKGNPKGIHAVGDLTRADLRVGLTDPQKSALGALCARMLEGLGIRDAVNRNVKTFTATADFLVTDMMAGALDAVIVYRANTSQVAGTLEVLPIDHPAAKAIQPYAIGKQSKHKQMASRLLSVITSAASRRQFESKGFRFLAESADPAGTRPSSETRR